MALLILTSLLFICIGTAGKLRRSGVAAPWRNAALLTLLAGFLFVALSTELLSLLHAFNTTGIAIIWVMVFLFSVWWLYRYRKEGVWPSRKIFRTPIVFPIAGILAITLVTGLLSFPNNWDSMTYHLSRVMHWLHRDSVAHYPTQIVRQLSLAPLSEYAIAHVFALQEIPSLGMLVQWSCFGGSLIAISLITRSLGGNRSTQWISALIGATLPMAILQASSTQNDLVVSFFVLCSIYFLLEMRKKDVGKWSWFFFPAAAACALLTKGTALLFLAPVTAIALVVAVQHRTRATVIYGIAGSALAVLILLPHHLRNTQTFGSPAGVDYELQNERYGFAPLLSGVAKNTAMHLRTPVEKINALNAQSVETWHRWIGTDIHDPALNWSYSPKYGQTDFSTHEDLAGNTIHIVLGIVIVLIILFSKKWRSQKNVLLYTSILILMWLLFCILVKWQIWHTRLHTPIFLTAAPLIALVMQNWHKRVRIFVMAILIVYSLPFIFMNQTRPLLWSAQLPDNSTLFSDNSMIGDLARNNNEIRSSYEQLSNIIDTHHIDTLGIISGGDSWEYPLWFLGTKHPSMVLNLLPQNTTKDLPDAYASTLPDVIIDMRNTTASDTLQYLDHSYIKTPFPSEHWHVFLKSP